MGFSLVIEIILKAKSCVFPINSLRLQFSGTKISSLTEPNLQPKHLLPFAIPQPLIAKLGLIRKITFFKKPNSLDLQRRIRNVAKLNKQGLLNLLPTFNFAFRHNYSIVRNSVSDSFALQKQFTHIRTCDSIKFMVAHLAA